ncbi:hypothetical protein CARUB_v10006000mg [Capsella rubella]|uniref:Acidic protein n=1 Tax=Capsella rubella TaxID=81985 RepID=R0GWY4_9BRAS|nr:probable thionin-2.4 [Capsella rubella]EOA15653.1 hypothetical protein CARUB_v10006000mg [Capsella rubella]
MEGKTLIISMLVMSLFMAQIQVDAKSCCPNTFARNIYNTCRFFKFPREDCRKNSGCTFVTSGTCPDGFPRDNLENTGDVVSEYCKVGCVSSVCSALTTLQTSDASEIVNKAAGNCALACSTVCTKGSMNAVETA